MPKTGIIWDDKYLSFNLGDGHPMNPKRLNIPFSLFKALKIFNRPDVKLYKPQPASDEEIKLFHSEKYIITMKELSQQGRGYNFRYGLGTGDCPVFPEMHEVSALIVGGALEGIKRIESGEVDQAFSLLGGLHHAFSEKAAGFCYYNDVVIAIKYLQKIYGYKRILYIDTDVHAGDGVLNAFYKEKSVLAISIHESPQFIFPGTGLSDETGEGEGLGYSINIPLYPETWDELYQDIFERIIPCIWKEYDPEFVIWQCGADGHYKDVLGHLALTTNLYSYLGKRIAELSRNSSSQGKLLLLGGGGYNPDSVARVWLSILAAIADIEVPSEPPNEWVDFCQIEYGLRVSNQLKDPIIDFNKIEQHNLIKEANRQYLEVLKEELESIPVWDICKNSFNSE
ncbi:MAG: acetoin utilization protein AcuC [Candidatus Hodarchaeales archaeon]